jgi:hypothetical protein
LACSFSGKPESVSVRPCVSFFVRDRSIKVHFIGRLRAIKMACGRMTRRAAGESYFQKNSGYDFVIAVKID